MFDTYKLNEKGFEEVAEFKCAMLTAAEKVLTLLPDGREKSLFLTKMEEAVFFGTKAVASKSLNYDERVVYSDGKVTTYGNDSCGT